MIVLKRVSRAQLHSARKKDMQKPRRIGKGVARKRARNLSVNLKLFAGEISAHEERAVESEFEAWVLFRGIKLNPLFWDDEIIPIAEVLVPCDATTMKELAERIEREFKDRLRSGALFEVRLVQEDFTAENRFKVAQNPAFEVRLKENRLRTELCEAFKPIEGRKRGWTLLGIKDAEYLQQVIREEFPDEAERIVRQRGLEVYQLKGLLLRARSVKRNRTVAANKRNKGQRAEAARLGWKQRRSR